jgi:predicted DNA-binding protein (UPF0251 family)
MSPRPLILRKISSPPAISGFKPYGSKQESDENESIFLHLEEYEALRLCDFEMLNHHDAAVYMTVSRPTLSRIYSRARQKIAEALVMGKQIIIEGGKVYFDSEWFSCNSCNCFFNNPEKQTEIKECPLCKSDNFSNYKQPDEDPLESLTGCSDICFCPACSFEQPHRSGYPCKNEICPECGEKMVRK